jgi:hypothetical protein
VSTLEFQCCFCEGPIVAGEVGPQRLDPCAVLLIGHWKGAEPQQLTQQFFCHIECFKQRLSDASYLAIDEMEPGDQA